MPRTLSAPAFPINFKEKAMLKKIFCLHFLCLMFTAAAFAQGLKVNNRQVGQGQTMPMFSQDLDAGKINFSFDAVGLKKAEITFDKGRNWQEMEKAGDNFIFKYRPLSDERISPEFMLTQEAAGIKVWRPDIRINYQKERPDQQVEQVLQKIKAFYEDENKSRFLGLFSAAYPDRVKFEQSIQNDFYNYRNIRLFYRIDSRSFDEDYQGAVWNVYWKRKCDDRNGNSLSDTSATIVMKFDNEGASWLVSGLRNNSIFGSSLLVRPDLLVSSLTVADDPGVYTASIEAVIQNTGSTAANNVTVKYYKKYMDAPPDADFVLIATQTITSVAANASVTDTAVIYDAVATAGGNYQFKAVVDPSDSIDESDETNNSKTASHDVGP
jgi:hypothetical protein